MRALRRLLGFLTLVGAAVGATVMLRRRFAQPHERVDLYYTDGAMASFEGRDAEAVRFFALGREALDVARTSV